MNENSASTLTEQIKKIVTLTRRPSTIDGTFGTMEVPGTPFTTCWDTLELPWKDNQHDISCIPTGTYECHMTHSPKFGRDTYELVGVLNRSDVRIHPANYAGDVSQGRKSELNGCIALGSHIAHVNSQAVIANSKNSVQAFEDLLDRKPFLLTIVQE